jgi:hypothetical protein
MSTTTPDTTAKLRQVSCSTSANGSSCGAPSPCTARHSPASAPARTASSNPKRNSSATCSATAPFDRVIGPIENLPAGERQELRDFCRAHDIKVTRAALTDDQADQLTVWLAERGHT